MTTQHFMPDGSPRTPERVREWLRTHKVLFYRETLIQMYVQTHVRCDSCGYVFVSQEAIYGWNPYTSQDRINASYWLCGFCDVQARVIALDFVRRLMGAIEGVDETDGRWEYDR